MKTITQKWTPTMFNLSVREKLEIYHFGIQLKRLAHYFSHSIKNMEVDGSDSDKENQFDYYNKDHM